MKRTLILITSLFLSATASVSAQNGSLQEAIMQGLGSVTLSDAQVADYSRQAVQEMDAKNPVAGQNDPYMARLNRIVARHRTISGIPINYKVYLVKDVNAFATADGSVRVMKGLMDIMSDQELLAVMGHEIGHVVNKDSRDAMKAALKRSALINLGASRSGVVGQISRSQVAGFADYLANAKHSRQQETEADDYGYEFLKRNNYNVMALATSFEKLAKLSGGSGSSRVADLMASHPNSTARAQRVRDRARRDGLAR